jgi:EAL domain-containing protein (putative c-di-GMP-specific phosphodiesterase class I)
MQSKTLQELGIELGQGFLFSKPLPAEELPLLFLRGLMSDSSRSVSANSLNRDSA